jgi:hypothetical protein
MSNQLDVQSDAGPTRSVGLDEVLAALRADLTAAQSAATNHEMQLPVQSATIELTVAVTKSVDGKAGFRVPVLGAELGASGGREATSTQKLTLTLGAPVDRLGQPIKVAGASDKDKG